jgi:class 3 adenylate cyclase
VASRERSPVSWDRLQRSPVFQDATRDLGEGLLLTEATRCLLDDPHTPLTIRGSLALKGKSEPVAVYGIPSRNDLRTAGA